MDTARVYAPPLMSLDDFEEFLADKPEHERWELIGGRVVKMMVGSRWEHGRIVQNLVRALDNRFDAAGSRCQAFAETLFVKEAALGASLLPDVMVVCGDIEPGATHVDAPTVVIEVLSAGTEARDRIQKWGLYQRLPSLQHYVLVSRERPHVEVFDRIGGDWSGLRVLDGLDAVLDLPAVAVSIPLAEIYRRIAFGR
jgi:Uma2 family endonuclease